MLSGASEPAPNPGSARLGPPRLDGPLCGLSGARSTRWSRPSAAGPSDDAVQQSPVSIRASSNYKSYAMSYVGSKKYRTFFHGGIVFPCGGCRRRHASRARRHRRWDQLVRQSRRLVGLSRVAACLPHTVHSEATPPCDHCQHWPACCQPAASPGGTEPQSAAGLQCERQCVSTLVFQASGLVLLRRLGR